MDAVNDGWRQRDVGEGEEHKYQWRARRGRTLRERVLQMLETDLMHNRVKRQTATPQPIMLNVDVALIKDIQGNPSKL